MKKIIVIIAILFVTNVHAQTGKILCFNKDQFLLIHVSEFKDSLIAINQPSIDSLSLVVAKQGQDIQNLQDANKLLIAQQATQNAAIIALAGRVTTAEANITTVTNKNAALETKVAGLKVTSKTTTTSTSTTTSTIQ